MYNLHSFYTHEDTVMSHLYSSTIAISLMASVHWDLPVTTVTTITIVITTTIIALSSKPVLAKIKSVIGR